METRNTSGKLENLDETEEEKKTKEEEKRKRKKKENIIY